MAGTKPTLRGIYIGETIDGWVWVGYDWQIAGESSTNNQQQTNTNTNTQTRSTNTSSTEGGGGETGKEFSLKIINDGVGVGSTTYTITGFGTFDENQQIRMDYNRIFQDSTQISPNFPQGIKPLKRFRLKKRTDSDSLLNLEISNDGGTNWVLEREINTLSNPLVEIHTSYESINNTDSNDNSSSNNDSGTTKKSILFGFLTNYSQPNFDIILESDNIEGGSVILKSEDDAYEIITNSNVFSNLRVRVSNTGNYDLSKIKWGYDSENFSDAGYNNGDNVLVLTDAEMQKNINIYVELQPSESKFPKIQAQNINFKFGVESSVIRFGGKSKGFNIPISIKSTDSVKIISPAGQRSINISAGDSFVNKLITLDFVSDFQKNVGSFRIIIVPTNSIFGDAQNPLYINVELSEQSDLPFMNKVEYPSEMTIPTYTMGNYNFEIAFESIGANYVIVYSKSVSDNNIVGRYSKKELLTLNLNNLKERGLVSGGIMDFIFVPYNSEGLDGDEYRVSIKYKEPSVYISTTRFKNDLFNAINENLLVNIQDTPKYLTHITEFDKEDKQVLISNWDIDYNTFSTFTTDELGNEIPVELKETAVLKLYEPLPTSFQKNDTLWISKLMSLPIIKTVVVTGQGLDIFPYLQGPNFNIDTEYSIGQSTQFESLEGLIQTGSISSQQIVDKYLYDNYSLVDGVSVDYSTFVNFIKFSSATERVANFRYKKELIEYYDDRILHLQQYTGSISAVNEIVEVETKKINLLNGFDGWENYLVSSSLSDFPKTGSFAKDFTSGSFNSDGEYIVSYNSDVVSWYNSVLGEAEQYDVSNINSLRNNIPQFLVDSGENTEYVLFLDMIGNHFDIIWTYIKGMTETKNITDKNTYGISDEFLYDYLKSLGWDARNLNSNNELWKYLYGTDGNGNVLQESSPKEITNVIWRRIANNLPYLLKNKGTNRGIKALLSCYGVPASNLSIIEFGGEDTAGAFEKTKYTYEVQTATLVFNDGAYLESNFSSSNAIEIRIKPHQSSSAMTLFSSSYFNLTLQTGSHSSGVSGSLRLEVETSGGLETITTPQYSFFDGNYHSILVNNRENDTTSSVELYYMMGEKDRIIKSGSSTTEIYDAYFVSASTIQFGGNFVGEADEIRLWNTPLSRSAYELHVLNPEAINGNHISSSTTDLLLRLDFEYPKDLNASPNVNNVAPINTYDVEVDAYGFSSQTTYPYNYNIIDRVLSLEIPNTGASRFSSNKIRFENQTVISDLSYKTRATLKASEDSRKDSNRLGLFFSPNKDLDLDIAKSFGGLSIDDYIGGYEDQYKDTYEDLTSLRNYYFERIVERDIYQFINLVKLYDKSLFVNLKQIVPARAKVTTGILIAPHLLERSKTKINKPTTEYTSSNVAGEIDIRETTLVSSSFDGNYEANLNLTSSTTLEGVFSNYSASIITPSNETLSGSVDSFEANIVDFNVLDLATGEINTYSSSVDAHSKTASLSIGFDFFAARPVAVGNTYIDYGFSTYWENGWGKYVYEDYGGVRRAKAVRGFLVTRRRDELIPTNETGISGSYYENNTLTTTYTNELIIQEAPYTASLITDPSIVAVTTASGYLNTHYIYTKDISVGLENSYFNGAKQTINTTIDGREPVEVFASNPTVIRVNDAGRPNSEPILIVD